MSSRTRPASLSRTSQNLLALAQALSQSGSRLEDQWWQQRLSEALTKALSSRQGHPVESTLDHLLEQRSPAYEILVEQAETHSESLFFTEDGQAWQAQLFSAPILAWTRYQLPKGTLTDPQRTQFKTLLQTCVLAPDARLHLVPNLVRFDQLPQSFRETRNWVQSLLNGQGIPRRSGTQSDDAEASLDLLADAYFLMGVVAVPHGEALFQWQSVPPQQPPNRESVATLWTEGCARITDHTFTGCLVDCLLPDAFYTSTRQADQAIRPLTLRAAATWLQTAAHIPGDHLRAAIVACGEQAIEEYRIGFCTRKSNDVIYGCVWPSLSREESALEPDNEGEVDTWDTLAALLRETGIQDVRRIPGLHAPEVCDDCGTPYFPNMRGEMQHPELPEEFDPEPVQFH